MHRGKAISSLMYGKACSKAAGLALVGLLWSLPSSSLWAQPTAEAPPPNQWDIPWLKPKEDAKFEIKMMVQLWSLYSWGQQLYDEEAQAYEAVDDRFNTKLRRARLIFDAQPYKRLKYTMALFYDLAGRDVLSGSVGGANSSQPNIGVWDAYFKYQLLPGQQTAWLAAGWMRPQMQRESITSGWSVNSMEKAMSQSYLRRHIVGTEPGRAAGFNLGGLWLGQGVGLNYNIGLFNPLYASDLPNTAGRKFAPLLTGRTVLYLGDPEMEAYRLGYETNYYGQRRGLSLDANFSYQGQTDIFERALAFGPGFLLNWGPLNLDGEWMFLSRSSSRLMEDDILRPFDYRSGTGHIRLGYNIPFSRYMLEPVFMAMRFTGGSTAMEQADAVAVQSFSGTEETYDLGVNLYLNRRDLKVTLHYTWHDGQAGAAGDGARVNPFFFQQGLGAIHRGDWLGLGLSAIF